MARNSQPASKGNSVVEKERKKIRRRYRQNIDKRVRIIPGQQDFITDMVLVLKLVNYSKRQIASIVGIGRAQVTEILEDPKTAERLQHLQNNIPTAALELMESYLVEAVQVVVEIMRTGEDDAVRLKAAGEVFDRAGMPKTKKSESEANIINTESHTFSTDGVLDAIRALPPDKQEEAAQMIEGLENFLAASAMAEAEAEDER